MSKADLPGASTLPENAFFVRTQVQASKSEFIRAQCILCYSQESFAIYGHSDCEDARVAQIGFAELGKRWQNQIAPLASALGRQPPSLGAPIEAGDGAMGFRSLVLRASRIPGEHFIRGSEELLRRPHQELVRCLEQLGIANVWTSDGVRVQGRDWSSPENFLCVSISRSSQFLSAILLNAWQLPFPLVIQTERVGVSQGYLELTLGFLRSCGMDISVEHGSDFARFRVEPRQKVSAASLHLDSDWSSMFALAVLGALAGRAELLLTSDQNSLQPDSIFPEHLRSMGVKAEIRSLSEGERASTGASSDEFRRPRSYLLVEKALELRGVNLNLANTPDLFPCLAVLCAFAEGPSELRGATHLVHKESDRIQGVAELLDLVGVANTPRPDGISITGKSWDEHKKIWSGRKPSLYSVRRDHRLAMAAGIFQWMGAPIQLDQPDVVNKSFPDFWRLLKGSSV